VSSRASSAVNATVTGGAIKTASSQQSGSARIASNAVVFFTRIQTCNLSGRASSRASATVIPSLQAQARFDGRASMASSRSIAFIIKAQFQSSARLSDISTGPVPDCECPPWLVEGQAPCNWKPPVVCVDQVDAELPYTLPSFRMQNLSKATYLGYTLRGLNVTPYLYTASASGVYHNVQTLICSWVNSTPSTTLWEQSVTLYTAYTNTLITRASLPFTLPVFRMYSYTSVISGCSYVYDPTLTCTIKNTSTLGLQFTNDQTLVNSFGRRGCQ
jgi:hypothetical protein